MQVTLKDNFQASSNNDFIDIGDSLSKEIKILEVTKNDSLKKIYE